MTKAYVSAVINAPVEAVRAVVRDFNSLPDWHPAIARREIEGREPSDRAGCIRSLHLQDGAHVRERLLSLDDTTPRLTYNLETPAFPPENYHACMELMPITDRNRTAIGRSCSGPPPSTSRRRTGASMPSSSAKRCSRQGWRRWGRNLRHG